MSNYTSEEYNSCKEWVAAKIQEGFTWEDVKNLCVPPDQVEWCKEQTMIHKTIDLCAGIGGIRRDLS